MRGWTRERNASVDSHAAEQPDSPCVAIAKVVDVEPKPSWHESDVSKFAALGANSDWFRGFLVYERMPGSRLDRTSEYLNRGSHCCGLYRKGAPSQDTMVVKHPQRKLHCCAMLR